MRKRQLLWLIPATLLAAVAALSWQLTHPPGLTGIQNLFWKQAAPPGSPVKVSFLGVATVLLDDGETALLTDGFFSRPDKMTVFLRKVAPDTQAIGDGLERARITLAGAAGSKLAAVIPLHSHYDHAMDAPEVAKLTGAVLMGSSSTLMMGKGWGLDDKQMQLAELRKHRAGFLTLLFGNLLNSDGIKIKSLSDSAYPLRRCIRTNRVALDNLHSLLFKQ